MAKWNLFKKHLLTRILYAIAAVCSALLLPDAAEAVGRHPEWRALLASPELDGQPVKGVYFFPGDQGGNVDKYTTHPIDPDDQHWNSGPDVRARVIARMLTAHVNTVVMSFWSFMPQWSPMVLDSSSVPGLLDAVEGRPVVILPGIESGFDPKAPSIPHWQFRSDPQGLLARVGELANLFGKRKSLWAQLYDREGEPRFAVQVIHACLDQEGLGDQQFADTFGDIAEQVDALFHIKVGFLLDTIGGCHYSAFPRSAGPILARQAAVLGVSGFASEVFSGKVINGPRCSEADWRRCHPHNNNADNLAVLADWKRAAAADWVASGLPVLLDLTNGFDGRIVWMNNPEGVGFWGDNMDTTDDRWRNWMSELKGGGIKGLVVDTWNGFTEGYATVPSREHGITVTSWLADLLEPDPQLCSHMHYADGRPTVRTYGAICEKWVQLGADRIFGAPITDESSEGAGRVSHFETGKAIYCCAQTGAHEMHGIIAQTYFSLGGASSCLGLPITDEEAAGDGRANRFEKGWIEWHPGETRGTPVCQ
jgi:LGFP repeat-containing protein